MHQKSNLVCLAFFAFFTLFSLQSNEYYGRIVLNGFRNLITPCPHQQGDAFASVLDTDQAVNLIKVFFDCRFTDTQFKSQLPVRRCRIGREKLEQFALPWCQALTQRPPAMVTKKHCMAPRPVCNQEYSGMV